MQLEEVTNKRILLSPLNWGMGHVSRCIGFIDKLHSQGNTLVVACSEDQKRVFEQYFDQLTFVSHEGYPFDFKGKGRFGMDLVNKSSSLFRRLKDERQQIEFMVDEHNIDLVLSDHRYGFRSKRVFSIFITHQINLPVRFHEAMVSVLHKQYMSKFDHIWVMDHPNSELAGDLSISKTENLSYIGPFSRFSRYSNRPVRDIERVLIASGPDVYAQQLIDEVVTSSEYSSDLIVIHNGKLSVPEGISSISGNWKEQDAIILRAKHIISRSGYSTIMDCNELAVKFTFFPTSGQREQEYLAARFSN